MNKAIIIPLLATVILFSMAGCAETKELPTAEAAVIQNAERLSRLPKSYYCMVPFAPSRSCSSDRNIYGE